MMEKTVLTHTKRKDWSNCHRYYYNRHVKRLVLRQEKRGRRKGGIFGDILFHIRELHEKDESLDWVSELSAHCAYLYQELTDSGNLDASAQAELELEEVKMRTIATAYIYKYGLDYRREVEFKYPLMDPYSGRLSEIWELGGKIDGVVITGEKKARIIEDKLVSQIQRLMIERLPLDTQVTEYVDAFMAHGWEASIEYRHTRWPGINPKPAKEFKTKPNYPGESLEEYEHRLFDDIGDRADFYFDVQLLMLPMDHMTEYQEERWMIARDIAMAETMLETDQELGVFYKNPSKCYEFGGCPYIPLCVKQPGAENLYLRIEEDNPELTREVSDGEATE